LDKIIIGNCEEYNYTTPNSPTVGYDSRIVKNGIYNKSDIKEDHEKYD
jgi:hypothetical protein